MPRRSVVLAPAVILVGAAGLTALQATRSDAPEPVASATSPAPGPEGTAAPTEGFEWFIHEPSGVSLAYPVDWQVLQSPDEQVVFLATPNGRDSVLVRVVDIGVEVDPDNVPAIQPLTDELVHRGEGVAVLAGPELVELGGLPGFFYFYRFDDADSGQTGVHSHYFVFQGSTMYVMIFQALPEDGFVELAPTFDRMASSFRVATR